jgi:heat shock protein HslJ
MVEVRVRADCNRCSGRHDLGAGARFRLDALVCTEVGCPSWRLQDVYGDLLWAARRYRTTAGWLTLESKRGALRFMR